VSPQDSLYPPDWREAARRDWNRVSALLGLNDAEAAALFLQQALEKYLKASVGAIGSPDLRCRARS
jgi:HEPN domain-containing protein